MSDLPAFPSGRFQVEALWLRPGLAVRADLGAVRLAPGELRLDGLDPRPHVVDAARIPVVPVDRGARLEGWLRHDGRRVAEVRLLDATGARHEGRVRWAGTSR